eukprot:747834-Prorocentrum_minimum.AAC.3
MNYYYSLITTKHQQHTRHYPAEVGQQLIDIVCDSYLQQHAQHEDDDVQPDHEQHAGPHELRLFRRLALACVNAGAAIGFAVELLTELARRARQLLPRRRAVVALLALLEEPLALLHDGLEPGGACGGATRTPRSGECPSLKGEFASRAARERDARLVALEKSRCSSEATRRGVTSPRRVLGDAEYFPQAGEMSGAERRQGDASHQ